MPKKGSGHQQGGTRTYRIWQAMLNRCRYPHFPGYAHYGGRGIKVCERWHSFAAFLADVGTCPDGMTLDRIDSCGHYEPGNCRWASRAQQAANKSNNVILEHDGLRLTITAWAERIGISRAGILRRLAVMPVAEALSKPSQRKGSRGGGKAEPEYVTWCVMRYRCCNPTNPDYHRYGGRGIAVCGRWQASYADFLADMGRKPPGHSLDRIDNDGPYSPDNCRWASPKEQSRNRRCTQRLTVKGETLSLDEWSERTGIDKQTLAYRVKRGWEPELIVTSAPHRGRKLSLRK
jgi:hypothetical protein